ncbi:MAG: hypothetical protein KAH14_09860 [Clostridiales bacterium]|nr:hypothetical protein [Clostridiales bacterium]
MKKALVIVMCIILVMTIPLVASAESQGYALKKGMTKKTKIIEAEISASALPDVINEGDLVNLTFTVPRSGSKWQYGEIAGLLEQVTIFNEDTCTYEITAVVDTSSAGVLDIVFEFIMTAGKSHVQFIAQYVVSTDILGESKNTDVTYFWNQDFESDGYAGWYTGNVYGTIILESGHARLFSGSNNGPYSFFDGSSIVWGDGWNNSINIYLDPSTMDTGEGFDYTVACNEADSTLLEKFTFHVIADGGMLLTATSNTSAPVSWSDIPTLPNKGTITTADWYTFKHCFYQDGDNLSVAMTISNSKGDIVYSETIDTTYLIASDVGGCRYGWFTTIADDAGILIDDFQRYPIQ